MKTTVSSFLGWMMVMAVFRNLQVEAGTYCDDSIFLRAGSRGVVSCDFGDFEALGWIYPTNDLEEAAPFISWDGSEIHQTESDNEEYSILPNGSLVIENVAVSHEKNYIARVYKNQGVFHEEVAVKVYVLPDPEHPVVNGRNDQDHVVVHSSNGGASFNCTMDHIRPAVPLEVVFVSDTFSSITKKTIQSTLNNSDGTHNVSLAVELRIGITQPIGVYSMLCKVGGYFAQLFPSVVTVDLVHDGRYNFPSVNGLDSQQHVVLDVDREGVLNCSVDRVPPYLILEWNLIQQDSPAEIVLEEHNHRSVDNGDGTFNIILISRYKTTSNSVQSLKLKCMFSGEEADLYPLYTTVELKFPAPDRGYDFPSVNGLDSLQHVVLVVDREGVLNCSVDRVPQGLILTWDLIQHDSPAEIVLEEHNHRSVDNGDGTFNVILISRYKTTSNSVQRLNLKCMFSGKEADLYPLYTTVELNFPAADSDSFSCNTSLFKQPLERLLIFVLSAISVLFIASTIYFTLKSRRISNKDPAPQVPLQEKEHMLQQAPNGNTHPDNSTMCHCRRNKVCCSKHHGNTHPDYRTV